MQRRCTEVRVFALDIGSLLHKLLYCIKLSCLACLQEIPVQLAAAGFSDLSEDPRGTLVALLGSLP